MPHVAQGGGQGAVCRSQRGASAISLCGCREMRTSGAVAAQHQQAAAHRRKHSITHTHTHTHIKTLASSSYGCGHFCHAALEARYAVYQWQRHQLVLQDGTGDHSYKLSEGGHDSGQHHSRGSGGITAVAVAAANNSTRSVGADVRAHSSGPSPLL